MKKQGLGLIGKIVLIAVISVVVTAAALVTVSGVRLKGTYNKLVMEELKATAEELNTSISSLNDDGDWSLGDDDIIYKGSDIIMEELSDLMDVLQGQTGVDFTLFYGDTRYLTTIRKAGTDERLIGTQASQKVIDATLTGGAEYAAYDLNIEGIPYMGYYTPLKNSDGSVVGMVFTGRPTEDLNKDFFSVLAFLIVIAIVIVIIVTVIGIWLNKRISAQMLDVTDSLNVLSDGKLDTTIQDDVCARSDELGTMGMSARSLIEKLSDIITTTKNMSSQLSTSGNELARSSNNASSAAIQVSTAVDDISKGTVQTAESIQTAAEETTIIADGINMINESVETLNEASDTMKNYCDETMNALEVLLGQNAKLSESVETIAQTIDRTNDSAKSISGLTEEIDSIATQTNLLSLNASIEAARAGEAGKGFAVVAGEISNLAAQAAQSAGNINGIVSELFRVTQESVEIMSVLLENSKEQGAQLDATKAAMDKMDLGIKNVADSATEIESRAKELEEAKTTLNNLIEDLSAISEENAATTEETNASMQELSATFSVINDEAEDLKQLAADLSETMSYFS
ncbi:MAG: methyl-accepting chemotaxis protein [Lachnospiraceae bacterium]|nr:methyl-accepting chemotaxis protein [Lachnospiraceae bacterium]